jgi:hypothetical protein
MIYIQAGREHTITALEDETVAYCIHALRAADGTGDILDPAMIPAGVVNPLTAGLALPLVENPQTAGEIPASTGLENTDPT